MVFVNPKDNGDANDQRWVRINRFLGRQDSLVNNGIPVTDSLTIPESDGIILVNVLRIANNDPAKT